MALGRLPGPWYTQPLSAIGHKSFRVSNIIKKKKTKEAWWVATGQPKLGINEDNLLCGKREKSKGGR